jgi:hypothetical protein
MEPGELRLSELGYMEAVTNRNQGSQLYNTTGLSEQPGYALSVGNFECRAGNLITTFIASN